jgi:uncharacterized protein YcgI (DUF1989 family)
MQRRPQDLTDSQAAYYADVSAGLKNQKPLTELYLPKESGAAFEVPQHHVLRITCSDGSQVCDFNAFSRDDPAEYFWAARTRTLYGSHLKVGSRLWSTEPNMRPMFTFITDTVEKQKLEKNATTHDLLYSRCSSRTWELRYGAKGHVNCDSNMKDALRRFGFSPDYVHDAFNIFMTTGLDENHNTFYLQSQTKKGDYVDLYAEIDTVVAVSCCPSACNGDTNKGLTFEVFKQPLRHDWEVKRP